MLDNFLTLLHKRLNNELYLSNVKFIISSLVNCFFSMMFKCWISRKHFQNKTKGAIFFKPSQYFARTNFTLL